MDQTHAGGLVCRAILQTTPEHNVKTFISLSSPQGGQFGGTDIHGRVCVSPCMHVSIEWHGKVGVQWNTQWECVGLCVSFDLYKKATLTGHGNSSAMFKLKGVKVGTLESLAPTILIFTAKNLEDLWRL